MRPDQPTQYMRADEPPHTHVYGNKEEESESELQGADLQRGGKEGKGSHRPDCQRSTGGSHVLQHRPHGSIASFTVVSEVDCHMLPPVHACSAGGERRERGHNSLVL
eukprot:362964-Chlamydomonas_euryale.AAC.1